MTIVAGNRRKLSLRGVVFGCSLLTVAFAPSAFAQTAVSPPTMSYAALPTLPLGGCGTVSQPVAPAKDKSPVYKKAVPVPCPPLTAPWAEAWLGGGGSNTFYGAWGGIVAALNDTHNVWTDGLVVRAEGVVGHYHYDTINVPGGVAEVGYDTAALMLGYRKVIGATTLTGYIGGNYESNHNPDPLAYVSGTKVGVRVLGEVYSKLSPDVDFYGQAWFSTAFYSWYLMGRPGFRVATDVWVGPEGFFFGKGPETVGLSCPLGSTTTGLGGCKYEEARVGAFVHLVFPERGDLVVSGGYRTPVVDNGGPAGYYAMVNFSFPIR